MANGRVSPGVCEVNIEGDKVINLFPRRFCITYDVTI